MDEALIKRVLPHSVEAEQSVIGAMLMDREAIISASEIVTGADFYQHQYGVMFEAMVELFNEGKPVDLVTLQNRLKEKDVPPEVSSLEFVRDIMTTVPTSANVKSYAGIVREKAVLRRLIKINEEIANTCYAGKDKLDDILAHTEKSVFDLLQSKGSGDFVPIRQVALNVLDKIETASKNQGRDGNSQRLPRSGFSHLGLSALGFCADCGPSVHGKDCLCAECGGSHCSKEKYALHGVQPGDVQGTAGQPYAFHGVQSGFPEAEDRNSVRF